MKASLQHFATPSPEADPVWANPRSRRELDLMRRKWFTQQQVRQRQEAMQKRFVQSDIPLSLFAAGLSFLFYKLYNTENRVVQDFSALNAHRDKAMELTRWLAEKNANHPLGQMLNPESLGTLGRAEVALSLGSAPEVVAEPVRLLRLKNPSNAFIHQLELEAQGYAKSFNRVATNVAGMEKLAIPLVSKTLGVSTQEVKTMVRQNPYGFIKALFSKGLTNPKYNQQFFNRIFSELTRASNLMGYIVAGTVGVGLVGIFLTRMELYNKRHAS